MFEGHRILSCIFVSVCGCMFFGAHFLVNSVAHILKHVGSLWKQSTIVKMQDALDSSGKCVAITNDGNVTMW